MGDIHSVGIVGSGIMGSGLAEVAARSGFDVVVRSRTKAGADGVIAGVAASLDRQVSKGKLEAADRDAIVARIQGTDHLGRVADCDRWCGLALPGLLKRLWERPEVGQVYQQG